MASISTNVQPGQVQPPKIPDTTSHNTHLLWQHISYLQQVVCPGDVIAMLPEEATVHIGPGVLPVDDALLAVKGGTLQITKHGTYACSMC